MRKFPVFVHVEKAGGTSINNMLHHFQQGYISPSPQYGQTFDESSLKKIQQLYPIKIGGIGGHRISPVAKFTAQQFRFSFVRNPIKRFLSHLNWQIHQMGIQHSLESFCNNPHFRNFQTYRLTTVRSSEQAKKIITDNYHFIGLIEEFDRSITTLSSLCYGAHDYLQYELKNKTSSSNSTYAWSELSEQQQKMVTQANAVDIELYEWIKNDFYAKLATPVLTTLVNTLQTPASSKIKRKISNAYLGRLTQPLVFKKVPYGY